MEQVTGDDKIRFEDTEPHELAAICHMEQGDARRFIMPDDLGRHKEQLGRPDVIYKSIRRGDDLVGFVVLVLDPDGRSVELRRIVVSEPGCGIGKRAVTLVGELSRHELGRNRIWLDVFESNERARHLYEKAGYSRFGESVHEGRVLILYERAV